MRRLLPPRSDAHRRRLAQPEPARGERLVQQPARALRAQPSAANCPQAAAISRPRVSRTVQDTPLAMTRFTNSRSTGLGLASHSLPGVGFSGLRLTCNSGPSLLCSFLPSRTEEHTSE